MGVGRAIEAKREKSLYFLEGIFIFKRHFIDRWGLGRGCWKGNRSNKKGRRHFQ